MNYSQESLERLQKLEKIKNLGVNPYPGKYSKLHNLADLHQSYKQKPELRPTDEVKKNPLSSYKTAGRLVAMRSHGKLSFAKLKDDTAELQICFIEELFADAEIELFKLLDVADFIGVTGELFLTNHGELTLMVKEFVLLAKTIRPLPEKWHGIKDQETKYRKRYLDLASDGDTFRRFQLRANFMRAMRDFYHQNGFIELQTPILVNKASGALATPFVTHHESLDLDVYLRIATETYLKKAVAGGFERVYELGPVFRNEGIDPSHLQEFYMCEHYAAYWDYEDNMRFTEEMIRYILDQLFGTQIVTIRDRDGNPHQVDFGKEWPRVTMAELIKKDANIDLAEVKTADQLRAAIKTQGIKLDVPNYEQLGYGNLLDVLYKKVSRPKLVEPVFLVKHPVDLSPLARRSDSEPELTDRFQLVVSSWEVVNAYSELVDPVDQKARLEDQARLKSQGDTEAMMMDEPFIEAMEHGMPPMSGWGMGIERIIALLTEQDNLRDVVLFPLLRPDAGSDTD